MSKSKKILISFITTLILCGLPLIFVYTSIIQTKLSVLLLSKPVSIQLSSGILFAVVIFTFLYILINAIVPTKKNNMPQASTDELKKMLQELLNRTSPLNSSFNLKTSSSDSENDLSKIQKTEISQPKIICNDTDNSIQNTEIDSINTDKTASFDDFNEVLTKNTSNNSERSFSDILDTPDQQPIKETITVENANNDTSNVNPKISPADKLNNKVNFTNKDEDSTKTQNIIKESASANSTSIINDKKIEIEQDKSVTETEETSDTPNDKNDNNASEAIIPAVDEDIFEPLEEQETSVEGIKSTEKELTSLSEQNEPATIPEIDDEDKGYIKMFAVRTTAKGIKQDSSPLFTLEQGEIKKTKKITENEKIILNSDEEKSEILNTSQIDTKSEPEEDEKAQKVFEPAEEIENTTSLNAETTDLDINILAEKEVEAMNQTLLELDEQLENKIITIDEVINENIDNQENNSASPDTEEQIEELEPVGSEYHTAYSGSIFSSKDSLLPNDYLFSKTVPSTSEEDKSNNIILSDGIYKINDSISPLEDKAVNHTFKKLVESVLI